MYDVRYGTFYNSSYTELKGGEGWGGMGLLMRVQMGMMFDTVAFKDPARPGPARW